MTLYEVTVTARDDLVIPYETYLREQHIPDILATGCFRAASISKSATGQLKMQYHADSRTDVDRYFAEHATRLRADAMSRFPEGITASRGIWDIVQQWGAQQ
jgi:hypothetical protein